MIWPRVILRSDILFGVSHAASAQYLYGEFFGVLPGSMLVSAMHWSACLRCESGGSGPSVERTVQRGARRTHCLLATLALNWGRKGIIVVF